MTRTVLAVAWCAALLACDSFGSNASDPVRDAGTGSLPGDDASARVDAGETSDAGDGGLPEAKGAFCNEQKALLADKLLGCADFDGPLIEFAERAAGLELSRPLGAFGREPVALLVSGSRDTTLRQGGLERVVPAPALGKTVTVRFLMKATTLASTDGGSGFVDVVGIVAAGDGAPFLGVRLESPTASPDTYKAQISGYALEGPPTTPLGAVVRVEVSVHRVSVNGIAIRGSVGSSVLAEKQFAQDQSVTSYTVYVGAELNKGKVNVGVSFDDVVIMTD